MFFFYIWFLKLDENSFILPVFWFIEWYKSKFKNVLKTFICQKPVEY